jgi:hypothetical protein
MLYVRYVHFIRNKPIFPSERMLHKDYNCKSSVGKEICGRGSQGAWRQDELIGGKPPVVKKLWLWLWLDSVENMKGLNLAAVKLTIVQVTKLPL